MPNPKLETYKNKATGTVYDFTDADAQSKVTATVDLLKDTTGWTGKNKAVFHGKGIYDLSTGVYTPLDPTNYGAWKKVSCKGGEKFVFVCNNAINQVIWYEWNGNTFISATPHSDLTSSYDEYTVGSNTTLVACVARLTGGNITDDSDFGNPMIADAVVYSLDPSYEPYHESVEDWYWSENAKKSVHNIFNPALFISSADANMATVNSDGSSIRVKVDSPSTFRLCAWYLNVTPNTDYTVKTSVAITAGKCAIKVETVGGTNIKTSNALSADGVIEMTFNSGNNTQLKFDIFCTWDVSEIGDITCNNLFIKETADTYNNFLPFAMTNGQLTEMQTGLNKQLNSGLLTTLDAFLAAASKSESGNLIYVSGDVVSVLTNNELSASGKLTVFNLTGGTFDWYGMIGAERFACGRLSNNQYSSHTIIK